MQDRARDGAANRLEQLEKPYQVGHIHSCLFVCEGDTELKERRGIDRVNGYTRPTLLRRKGGSESE
jgi:hypothetical protein